MSAPGIELRWGHGFESTKPRKRDAFRPLLKTAIDLAAEGLENEGITLADKKYIVAEQASSRNHIKGLSLRKSCHLYITPSEIQRRNIDIVWNAGTIFHELFHLAYKETIEEDSLPYFAATEGLAYTADYYFINELLESRNRKGWAHRQVEKVASLPKRDAAEIVSRFWKASARQPYTFDCHSEWFERIMPGFRISRGEAVGILAVSKQLQDGVELADLITMPPCDVLDAA